MISTAISTAILSHPYHLMLAAVVLFQAGRQLFAAKERIPDVEPNDLPEAA